MKLLYITNGINGSGGLERVLSIKASFLAEKYGYEVVILCLNNGHKDPFYTFSDKIKMLSIDVCGNPLHYVRAYTKGIKNIVESINPNIISVCDDGLKGFFVPKIISCKLPIIYERHVSKEIEMNDSFSFWKKLAIKLKWHLMEFLAKSFSAFIVLTNGNTKEWPSLKNMQVIPNPLSFFPEESSNLENKKVLAVGKQSYQKGYDLLLKAWQLVQQQHPDWKLEIYGKKDSSQNLDVLANQLGVNTAVSFFDPEKNIQEKYLESAVYVMSSRYEGFGMVLIEAMACGVPCVAFDCNYGPSDIIADNEDGLIVPSGDFTSLANAMITLMNSFNSRVIMGNKAKQNVKRFLPDVVVGQWDSLFNKIMQ